MFPVNDKYSVGTVAHLFCQTLYARQLLLGLVESFTELQSEALPTLSLHPIPFVCIKPPLTHCAWVPCATGVSPKTSIGICFLGPKLMQFIRHNQSLISNLSSSDNPDSSEAKANLPEKFI